MPKPHEQRVVAEKAELDAKLEKLHAFLGTEPFVALSAKEKALLERQADVMGEYSFILRDRIALFQS